MKILLATSSVTPNAGIPSYNRELCLLYGKNNDMHLLVDENIKSYTGYSKVFSTSETNIYNYNDCRDLVDMLNAEKYDLIINSNSHVMSIIAPYMCDSSKIISVSHSLKTMDSDNAAINHKYLDGIIALSENCKLYLQNRFNIDKKRIHVVFNSVANIPNSEQICIKKKQSKELSIVFAGGTAPSKTPEIVLRVLIELLKSDKNFKFYWLGNLTPPLKKLQPFRSVQEILEEELINDKRVIFTGRIPQQEAARIISECNIFFAPSRREGFPMALLEAFRTGCIPIVADYNIANKEIIKNSVNGFIIDHSHIELFSKRIFDIIDNHESYSAIYDQTYKTFVDELSFPHWQRKMDLLLNDVLMNHAKRKLLNNKFDFFLNKTHFLIRYCWDYFENLIVEILPCAYKFYRMYRNK